MKKRLLAMLLVLMLVVSLLPVGALAADGDTVNRIRLMDKNAWGLAAIEKAGYSNEDVLWSNITSIRFFASDGSYTNWGVARDEVPDCYSHEGYLATDAGTKIVPSSVDRIVVELRFAYNGLEAGKIISATAVFHDEEFTLDYSEGAAGVREYAEFTLKSGQSYDKDYSVTFYFQPIGKADWELYDIVYVDAGTSIGSDMPAEPDYGSQDFVSWQTNKDGSGVTLTPETVINKDWVVYGTKTSAGGATAYHVMRDSTGGRYNALQDEVADIYNAANDTAYNSGNVQITAIQVNGNGDEHTNPNYVTNEWKDGSNYYYIHNMNEYAADATPNAQNTRIPVNEITGITLIGTIDGNSFNVTIPKAELSWQEITNPGTTDTIVEIKVCDKLDGITKELVDSAAEAPEELTGVSYPVDGKVTIPEDGTVTLLYKITVTGDDKAEYKVTDEGATPVDGYSLTGQLDTNGVAVIYVTKTFSADDVVDGVLTNSASLSNDNTTLPPDDGNKEDEVEVEVEDEGGEEPGPEPVAELDVTKTVAIPDSKGTAAVGDILEYTVTISSLNSVAATGVKVTDTMWESDSSVMIGGKDGTLQAVTAGEDGYYVTVDVPPTGSVVIYYTYTVPETAAGKTVDNTVTAGTASSMTSTAVDEAEEDPTPDKPRDPTEDELNQLYVDLECINADAQHAEKRFHLDQDNSYVTVDFTTGICTVEPRYDFILDTYNDQVAGVHTYADAGEKTLMLTWDADTEAWVAGETSITRSVQCESTEFPDDYVAEYHVMNLYDELDIIAAKWDKAFTGFYLTERLDESLGKPNKGPVDGNGWDDERTYYTVKNGAYGSDEYMAYTDVYGLNYYYIQDNGTALTTATYLFTDILVTAPDENHVSEIYVLFDIRLYDDYNNGYWYDRDQDGYLDWVVYKAQSFDSGNGRWKAGSDIILEDLDGSRPYYEPTHADVNGRDVVFLGWDVENHETIYEPGDRPDNLITDKFSITEDVLSKCNITPLEVCLYGVYGYAEPDVTDYTVTIAPANIIAYTGGTAYGAIVDGSGNEFEQTTSGLPEPGYHLELSQDIQDWLEEQTGQPVGNDLSTYLTFYYEDNGTIIRQWSLDLLGVYSTDATGTATQYVYGMNTDIGEYDVRLQYWNGTEYVFEDDIDMSAASVNETYTMSIYGGGLDQSSIKAVLTVGDESIEATTVTDTGELTVLSTTNEEYTTDLNEDSSSRITADVNDGTTFTVNDSEVTLEPEDVKLLVDSVSNNDDFNAALEDDARDHVSMYNAGTESFYLDLVHADNGNVQVGLDGSLTISWPMPDDADPDGEFTIVHYVDMDRSAVMGEDNLANAVKEEIRVTPNGDQLIFDVDSFSPFVLVYEAEERTPIIPIPDLDDDDDDDTEYVPKWLNTEDHFAYIVGYEDGEVKPNNNITRAEVATIFFRLLTDDARARYWSQTNDYTDVAADSWYNNAISTLSNMGIINGYEDGTFKPNAPITRAEFTAIATRFFDYTAEYDGAFNDVSRSAWYADCVQAAVDMGLVDGYPDGGFHPNSNITRAEAVTIVNRVLNRAPHEDHLLDEDEMNVWPDNVYGAWYYADMQEATNSHDYDWIRVSGERVEEWTEKLPERDWAALEQEWSSAYSG